MSTTQGGRAWAYFGAILGGAASIAANVAHSFIAPADAPQDWTPEPGAVISALLWPVFLFVAVEILTRVAWPKGWIWHVVRFMGLLPVSGVAALVSYRHLSGLLAHYGEDDVVVYAGPIAIDGLMVMATAALLATAARQPKPNPQPAPTADVTAPVAPVAPTSPAPAVTSTFEPIIHQPITQPTPTAVPDPVTVTATDRPATTLTPSLVDTTPALPAIPAPTPEPEPAPTIPLTPADLAARITKPRPTAPAASEPAPGPAARTTRPTPSTPTTRPAPPLAPSATDTTVTEPDAAQPQLPILPPALLAKAREVVAQYRTDNGTPITAGQLAVRLKVTSALAEQILAVPDLDTDSPTRTNHTVNGHALKATR